jgi:hypothetical protein
VPRPTTRSLTFDFGTATPADKRTLRKRCERLVKAVILKMAAWNSMATWTLTLNLLLKVAHLIQDVILLEMI